MHLILPAYMRTASTSCYPYSCTIVNIRYIDGSQYNFSQQKYNVWEFKMHNLVHAMMQSLKSYTTIKRYITFVCSSMSSLFGTVIQHPVVSDFDNVI